MAGAAVVGVAVAEYAVRRPEKMDGSQCLRVRLYNS